MPSCVEIGSLACSLTALGFNYLEGNSAGVPPIEKISDSRLRLIADTNGYVLMATLKPEPVQALRERLAALGLKVSEQPIHIAHGKVTLDFVALRVSATPQ